MSSLTIGRKPGQKVIIDGRIVVAVSELRKAQCRLHITVPASVSIVREEARQKYWCAECQDTGRDVGNVQPCPVCRGHLPAILPPVGDTYAALTALQAAVDCALAHLRAASTWGANSAERHGHLADAQRVLEEARR